MLVRLIIPRPFTGSMAETEDCAPLVRLLDRPRVEPALAMERAWIAGHVGRDPYLAAAETDAPIPDSIYVRNERKAGGVEDIFEPSVALPQYGQRRPCAGPIEC